MTKRCLFCGRFYDHKQEQKMCKECKSHYEITFEKLKTNKALHGVMQRLADR